MQQCSKLRGGTPRLSYCRGVGVPATHRTNVLQTPLQVLGLGPVSVVAMGVGSSVSVAPAAAAVVVEALVRDILIVAVPAWNP